MSGGFVLFIASLLLATPAPARKLPVLIVDGQSNHDWETTTAALKATLLDAGRFAVEVATSPPAKSPPETWTTWRPAFAGHAAVVLNYNGERWPREVEESLVAYVRGGGGLVVVHASNNPFSGWAEYDEMIGLGWRGKEYGDRITLDDKGQIVRTPKGEGPGAGHGEQHEYVVTVRGPRHPITRGLPPRWVHGRDELYHGQRGPAQNMTVLLSAFSDPATKGTGAHEPLLWWIPFGKGKVVTNLMGHHGRGQKEPTALECVGFRTVLARSVEWVATGKVTVPVPRTFPKPR